MLTFNHIQLFERPALEYIALSECTSIIN